MSDNPRDAVRAYYAALRAGEPLDPFFAGGGPVVKVGVWSRHVGADVVASELREQTATTGDWVVESRDLHVGTVDGDSADADDGNDVEPSGGSFAWFGDDVSMAWTDTDGGERFEFDTRWSGAMVRQGDEWRFVAMHVSTAGAS